MKFASTRLIAADIKAVVGFYETLTGLTAEWLAPVFAEIVTPAGVLAIGGVETVALFKASSAEPAANRTAILEFQVADVEAEFARLKDQVVVVQEPKMMPWGNQAAQFRDPEGTLVSLFTRSPKRPRPGSTGGDFDGAEPLDRADLKAGLAPDAERPYDLGRTFAGRKKNAPYCGMIDEPIARYSASFATTLPTRDVIERW